MKFGLYWPSGIFVNGGRIIDRCRMQKLKPHIVSLKTKAKYDEMASMQKRQVAL